MNDDFIEDIDTSNDTTLYDKDLATGDKANNNTKIHKRIDEILEEKRLKALLDDSDDWSF